MTLPMIAFWIFLFLSGYGCAVIVNGIKEMRRIDRQIESMVAEARKHNQSREVAEEFRHSYRRNSF